MQKTKKALAIVAGPYRYYQVLWLYTQFPEYEWSILLLPYGKGNKMVNDLYSKSKDLGIFNKIYVSNMTNQDSKRIEQFSIILKMIIYYILGEKRSLMRKIVLSQTGGTDYDVFFVGCEYSIIEGATIGLADKKEVYIFEEGLGDYVSKKKIPGLSIIEWASYLVTKMGYFSPYAFFELKNSALCVKYASLPQLLNQRNYKKIRTLFSGDELSYSKYNSLLNKIYAFSPDNFMGDEVVFFTSPWDWEKEEKNNYLQKIHEWMHLNYSNRKILIKKHPRDEENYNWTDMQCEFIPENIPAEIIVQYMKEQEVVMMGTSTTLLTLLQKIKKIKVFQFDNLHGEYERNIQDKVRVLNIQDKIVHL